MSRNDIIKNVKPIKLTDDELWMYSDYSKSDKRIARSEIWRCVENDQPIPNELKPILLEVLQTKYPKMGNVVTAKKWRVRVSEVIYLTRGIKQTGYPDVSGKLTRTAAIKLVATKHILDPNTLTRELVKPIHIGLIESIKLLG